MGAAVEYEPMQRLNGGEEKILVSVRLRPLNEKETATNDISEWECINENTIVSRNSLSASERSMYPSSYTFDRVFGPGCSTRQVYGEGAKEVALCGLRGIHSSIFAYGQTSSGKTYTMGGITEYAVADIFEHVNKHKEREFVLKFSAIEIYNESVRDLLSTDPSPLRLLDDPEKGTVVERLIEETIRSWNHFKELLSFCQAQRQVGETNLNETSSRSHQILRLTIESSARVFDRSSALAATVNFIDLAGSERASQSHAAGTRLKEGCHINRSLLTLGTVIRKLSKGRNGHIPYRDSKLTRILQSSLGGNARTAIICTMSPARMHVEQSRNTLLFASCAKEVTTNAQVNVVISDKALVKQLKRELTRLENELKSKGMKMVPPDVAEVMREKDREIDRLKKEMAELTRQLNYAQAQVEDLLLADDRSSSTTWVDQYNHYPKLRVRDSVRSEHSTSYSSLSGTTQFVYASFGSFDASVSTDRRSTSSTEDNFTQFTDLDERFLQQNSSPEPSIISGNLNQNDEHHEDIEEPIKEDTQNNCKEVECIQVEEPFEKRYSSSALAGSSPTKYAQSYPSSPSINTGTSGVPEVDQDDRVKTQFESLTIEEHKVSAHSYVSSPDINTGTSEVIEVAHDDGAKQKLESSKIEEHKELISESILLISESILPSSQQPSPLPIEFGSSNLVKSRSCTARDLSKSMLWYPELERAESAPLVEFERCFEQRSEGLKPFEFEKPGRSEDLKYDQDAEKSSGNDPQTPVENTADDDLKEKTLETVTDSYTAKDIEESSRNNSQIRMENTADDDLKEKTIEVVTDCKTSTARESEAEMISGVSDTEEESEPDTDSGLELEPVQESEPEPISSKNSVKWIRLDSIRLDDKKSSTWPLEFKKLQREIINLWHACNISLIHRTYFFMIYNGDPVDSFYMHLEIKRISFLKHVFSKGTKTMVNGEIVTPGSSKRALNEERQMLSRQMLKRLTKDERENLFLRWGITLNSNNRRMQLANRLWSKTDLDHVTECTTLVAKLIGFKQNEKPMKEMFGLLNFTPKRGRKTSLWKFGGLSFL